MKIIINPTDNHIDMGKIAGPKDLIISQFKIDSLRFNHIFLPPTGTDAGNLNNAFWIINSAEQIDIEKIEQIQILGINFKFHDLCPEMILKNKSDVEIVELKMNTKKSQAMIIIKKEVVEKAIRHPFLTHYFERDSDEFKHYYELWFLCLLKNKIKVNYYVCKLKFLKFMKNKDFKRKYCKLIKNEGELVNIGNEGIIIRDSENKRITKIVKKWYRYAIWFNDFALSPIYDGPKKFYEKDLNLTCKINNVNQDKVDLEEYVEYEYDNKLLPTIDFALPHLARFAIEQIKQDVYILDVKKENFAKLPLGKNFFKLVYSDFGKGFAKINEKKEDFKLTVCRDLFILSHDYKSWKYRETIRATRAAKTEKDIKKVLNKKILKLYDFVKTGYKDDLWPCHKKEDFKKCERANWETNFKICNNSSSMRFLRKEENEKLNVYDLKTHKIYECNFKNLKTSIEKDQNIKFSKLIGLNDNLDEGIIGYEHKDNRSSCD